MRHLWFLGLCFTIAACHESAPADGAVRVFVKYGSYEPKCLRIIASDGHGHEGQTDIPNDQFHYKNERQVRAAVFRKPDWGRDLAIEVVSLDAVERIDNETRCSGSELERLRTPEPIVVPQRDFATFTATLQARDDDGDGHVLKTRDVAGTDCDDTKATIHPGVLEACGGKVDYDCDGQPGCADPECLNEACDDGNACTLGDTCVDVEGAEPQCQGTPKTCAPPNLSCFNSAPSCNPETGECLYTPLDAGVSCDDSDACTKPGQCNGLGECKVKPLPACEAQNECHLAARLSCPGSELCTEWINPAQVDQECKDGGKTGWCRSDGICSVFRFLPSNFDPAVIAQRDRSWDVVISCGTPSNPVVFDSGTLEWTPPQGCMLPDRPVAQVLSSGDARMIIIPMQSLAIQAGSALKLVGPLPVILAVYGDATLDGALLADADGKDPGAGGNRQGCDAQAGEDGTFVLGAGRGAGGGGGGFGRAGAGGGKANSSSTGGRAGSSVRSILVPLVGGCPGGTGGSRFGTGKGGAGGSGGGALQLAVAGTLKVNHWISVSGGGGQGGKGSSNGGENAEGGGGGGSGGGLLLEAARLQITSTARLIANGGSGAEGGDSRADKKGADGNDGALDSMNPAHGGDGGGVGAPGGDAGAENSPAVVGGDGVANGGAAGGGGGGVGVIVLRGIEDCDVHTSCDRTDNSGCDISPRVAPICPPLSE